jgi:hypothetical protein
VQPSPSPRSAGASATGAASSFPWWGSFALREGEGGAWEVGPLALAVERGAREWRVSWDHHVAAGAGDGRGTELRCSVRCPLPAAELAAGAHVARFAAHATAEALKLAPQLPDRPVVARPETPLNLLGGEEISLFVAFPVWVRVLVDGDRQLVEVPSLRLADTWFGPSTRYGELCYAVRTSARLEVGDLVACPHLAICRVRLVNHATSSLLVDRLSLPAHPLDLWWHPERGLWTRGLEVARAPDGTLASLRLGAGPPDDVAGAEPVAAARQPEPRLALVRALEALLA